MFHYKCNSVKNIIRSISLGEEIGVLKTSNFSMLELKVKHSLVEVRQLVPCLLKIQF
jgi:hypothetical protein